MFPKTKEREPNKLCSENGNSRVGLQNEKNGGRAKVGERDAECETVMI